MSHDTASSTTTSPSKGFDTNGTKTRLGGLAHQGWIIATFLAVASLKGVPSIRLRRGLGVTPKTAWFLDRHLGEEKDSNGGPFTVAGRGRRNLRSGYSSGTSGTQAGESWLMLDVSLANGPCARSKLAPVGDEKKRVLDSRRCAGGSLRS